MLNVDSVYEFRVYSHQLKTTSRFVRDTFSSKSEWRYISSDRYGNELSNFAISEETAEISYNHARTIAWKMPDKVSVEIEKFTTTVNN